MCFAQRHHLTSVRILPGDDFGLHGLLMVRVAQGRLYAIGDAIVEVPRLGIDDRAAFVREFLSSYPKWIRRVCVVPFHGSDRSCARCDARS